VSPKTIARMYGNFEFMIVFLFLIFRIDSH
jgi:hypothetical protein